MGSLNLDIVVPVPHHPAPGETVLGGDHFRNPGGKGANQAVAAARLGRAVAMVGRVGDDEAGRELIGSLEREGVDHSSVSVAHDAPTGIAIIDVETAGEVAARVGIQVDAVGTTAAGDGFCGGLADALARGESLEDVVGWGVAVGSLTTRRRGAQSSLPTRREVEQAR